MDQIRPTFPDAEPLWVFFRRVWIARAFVARGVLAGVVFSGLLWGALQPKYEAAMIVAPLATDADEQGFVAGDFRVDRPLTGAVVPEEFVWFQQILREPTVAAVLLRYPGTQSGVARDHLFRFGSRRVETAAELARYLSDHVTLDPIGASRNMRITYRHPDPDFAAELLRRLHKVADEVLRDRARDQTNERVQWLQKQMGQTINPDHRQALTALLMAQERRRMLAAMDQAFSATVLEPPAAGQRPVSPCGVLLLFFGALAGGTAGYLFSLFSKRRISG